MDNLGEFIVCLRDKIVQTRCLMQWAQTEIFLHLQELYHLFYSLTFYFNSREVHHHILKLLNAKIKINRWWGI